VQPADGSGEYHEAVAASALSGFDSGVVCHWLRQCRPCGYYPWSTGGASGTLILNVDRAGVGNKIKICLVRSVRRHIEPERSVASTGG
jgi:hypothetical protein